MDVELEDEAVVTVLALEVVNVDVVTVVDVAVVVVVDLHQRHGEGLL